MKLKANQRRSRAGFSIMEILVVIAIIATLVGMLVVAVLPSIGTSHNKNTRALLKKLDGEIMYQWGEANKSFSKNPYVPPEIQVVFGCDSDTAKVIWQKLQLKAAFPMTYAEALDPAGGNATLQTVLKPRTIFLRNIKSSTPQAGENAACLFLALQQNFGGKKFDAESALGASALKDTDGDGLMEIVDSFGNPVFFFRWGTGNPDLDALARGGVGVVDRDTEDPQHFLMKTNWNPDGTGTVPVGVQRFQALCHSIRQGNNRQSYFTTPAVVSAGKDGKIGLDASMAIQSASDADDNLYSFKTR